MDKNLVYLIQTDTTVGFLSFDRQKLAEAKNREIKQPFLISTDSFKKLKELSRVPKRYKHFVRRSKKQTFLYPNKRAIRVVKELEHSSFLKNFYFLYSTSANENLKLFNYNYAFNKADIIVEDSRGLVERQASNIFKLGKKRAKKLR